MDPLIVGHQKELTLLFNQIVKGTFPHAVLLSGPSGVGKRLIAKSIAKSLACESPNISGGCSACPNCAVITSGNYPDLITIDCTDKETSKTSSVRELLHSLHLKTYTNSPRIIIFTDAEELKPQAANALLKSLEEPHDNTFFILTSSKRTAILPTIISRCQSWYLKELSPNDITQIAETHLENVDKKVLETIAILADGSVENLDNLEHHLGEWKKINTGISKVCSGNLASAIELTLHLPKEREELSEILQLMRISARSLMKKTPSPEIAYLLSELTIADYYIFSRNLSASYLLGHIFTNAARKNSNAPSIAEIAA